MAETPSTMLPLGTPAPNFVLTDAITDKQIALTDVKSNVATVIMFICNHCPYVISIRDKLVAVANQYQAQGIAFVAINSNDVNTYPADNPEHMKAEGQKHKFPFPYLFDETQEVARAYQAACTPDFYVFDSNLLCVYRGRFDDSTPGNKREVTGRELTKTLDDILQGNSVSEDQLPSVGCNIKWKK